MTLLKQYAGIIKKLSLLVMLVAPFFLYFAANSGSELLLYLFLGVMSLSMLAALLVD